MNRLLFSFIILLSIVSCNAELERGLKSTDPQKIMSIADNFFNKKKYAHAVTLYERMVPFIAGTDLASVVTYKSADANFKLKNYTLAGHQFKNFNTNFRRDSLAEKALYMSAICYYKGSSEYDLDQTNTSNAITELQNFIDTYPNSNKLQECNLYMKELRGKLEKKAFENARTLYKTMKYKAAVVAFGNVMSEFPDSSLKEEVYYYNILSKYELARKSIFELKKDRIKETETAIRLLFKEFPETKYKKQILNIEENLNSVKTEHHKHIQLLDEQKKMLKSN